MAEPIIDVLVEVWDDIAALGADLDEAQWDRPTDCPGWSVKDNVAHMLGTEQMLLGVQPPADAVVGEEHHVRNDIGKFNEQWVVAYRHRPGAVALADFRAVTATRVDALRALPPAKWDEEGFTPEGPGPYRLFMEIRAFDCWFHDQDMREALGRPGAMAGAAAELAVDRIIRKGLPYIVGKKAGAPQGSTVVFEITGPGARSVAVAVEGRAAVLPDVPAEPTARITLDRRTFTRLGGGRWSGERARAEGALEVTGDTALADAVVDNMGFTI